MGALIFDLDDTLFDHAAAMAAFLRAFYDLADGEVAQLLALDQRGTTAREVTCAAIGELVGQQAEEVWATLQTSLGQFAVPIAPGIVALAAERFDVALLTNGGSATQRPKIAALGLDAVLPPGRILISGELGVWKPAAAAFEAALSAVGSAACDAVYVGDNPAHDIAGARSAGLRTCWVARGRSFPDTPPPDWIIDSIADLPTVWDEFPT